MGWGALPLTACVREATASDISYLAPRLRKADRDEVIATVGMSPEEFLPGSLTGALTALTMVADGGEPIGVFGVHPVPDMPLVGAVWLLATPLLEQHATTFLRQSRRWVNALHDVRPVLINLVDARNTVHMRWIEWCGFVFLARHDRFGAGQIPFIEFAKVKPECATQPPF